MSQNQVLLKFIRIRIIMGSQIDTTFTDNESERFIAISSGRLSMSVSINGRTSRIAAAKKFLFSAFSWSAF